MKLVRVKFAGTVLCAYITGHRAGLPKCETIFFLQCREVAIRILSAIFGIVVPTKLAAPVDALVLDTNLAQTPGHLDHVRAVLAAPKLKHLIHSRLVD